MKTHIEYFYERVQTTPDAIFLRQPTGNRWKELTWKQAYDEAIRMAGYIRTLNLPAESHIAILSKNCYHWVLADLAIMMTGHISVPFFPNVCVSCIPFSNHQPSNFQIVFVYLKRSPQRRWPPST